MCAPNHPSILKLKKSPANIRIPLHLKYFQVPIYFQFILISSFCCHNLFRETIPYINYSLSEGLLSYSRLTLLKQKIFTEEEL